MENYQDTQEVLAQLGIKYSPRVRQPDCVSMAVDEYVNGKNDDRSLARLIEKDIANTIICLQEIDKLNDRLIEITWYMKCLSLEKQGTDINKLHSRDYSTISLFDDEGDIMDIDTDTDYYITNEFEEIEKKSNANLDLALKKTQKSLSMLGDFSKQIDRAKVLVERLRHFFNNERGRVSKELLLGDFGTENRPEHELMCNEAIATLNEIHETYKIKEEEVTVRDALNKVIVCNGDQLTETNANNKETLLTRLTDILNSLKERRSVYLSLDISCDVLVTQAIRLETIIQKRIYNESVTQGEEKE